MDIQIEQPQQKDFEELKELFVSVITNNFKQYGFYEKFRKDIDREVDKQIKALEKYFENNDKDICFLQAKIDNKIVGTIAYGIPPSPDIVKYYPIDLHHTPEIKSAYVLPEYQGKGIGSVLLKEIMKALQENGFKEFVLDSGYPNAQKFWKKRLGEEPVKVIINRWGAGNDYMIWHKKL
jgi:ribosomal protein S18 acetylase RimI-like enzyme